MPFVPAEDTARVSINFLSANGEDATNVLHFQNTASGANFLTMGELLDALEDWLTTKWAPAASNEWQTDFLEALSINAADGPLVTRVLTVNGTVAQPALPAQNTIAVSARSGFSGRSRRGRIFHVGMPENFVTGSTINSLGSAQVLATYEQLLTTLAPTEWRYVIASFVSNKAPRATALLTNVTNFILTDVIVDSMDSRKPKQ